MLFGEGGYDRLDLRLIRPLAEFGHGCARLPLPGLVFAPDDRNRIAGSRNADKGSVQGNS